MYQLEAEDARHTEYFYRLIDIYVYFNIRAWKTLDTKGRKNSYNPALKGPQSLDYYTGYWPQVRA